MFYSRPLHASSLLCAALLALSVLSGFHLTPAAAIPTVRHNHAPGYVFRD